MNVKNSLRGRLAAACVLLATIIGAVFALAGYIIIESIEHQLIEERLTRAAQLMIQNRRAGVSIPATTQLEQHLHHLVPT